MKDVVVRSVENDEELRQANDLMAGAQGDRYSGAHAWLTSFGGEYPGYLREHTRIAVYGGHVAAALRLTTDTIRIGEARLKMGGLGWVATDSAWRRRGIISRVMTDTMRYMEEQRYHVSMLFGAPEFHRRWGFAPALCEHITSVSLDQANPLPPQSTFRMRFAKPGDIPVMQKIHALHESELACSLIRTQAHLANKWRQWETVRVLTDGRGKVAAYFRGRLLDSGYTVDEFGAADADACAGVLHAAALLSRQAGAAWLSFNGPPDHPMVRQVRRRCAEMGLEIAAHTVGMMAFANVGEALESMIPEWENRLLRLAPVPPHAELTLLAGRTAWRVRAHHGAVDISPGSGGNKIAFSAQELIGLTVGALELGEVLASKRHILGTEAAVLLRAMFPKRTPYVWTVDRF